eukprot:5481373-Ditylum_brightwellii.AAC.1
MTQSLLTEIRSLIQATARAYRENKLGVKAEDVGTHSNRSGAAMVMYLAGVPVYTIMLIGRWSSDAFLRYIRKQVQDFTMGISGKMLLTPDIYTVPDEG